MKVKSLHTHRSATLPASCSQWLRFHSGLRLLTAAALVAAAGCAGSSAGLAADTSDTHQVAADESTHTALRNGVFATPQAVGGSAVDGVGVFLSAVDNTAELTLYVVAPAESVTFSRPSLYLTTQEADHSKTEVAEFEDVTLDAGDSRVFRAEADGMLMEVFADFAGEES
jgi:hypothetical protein